MLKKYLSKQHVRYLLVGGLAYILELTILFCLHKFVGLSATLATAIAFWVSIFTSFVLQKVLSFKNLDKKVTVISKQFFIYAALILFNYIFTIAVVSIFPERMLLFSRTLALVCVTVWNFFIYQKIIFASSRNSKHSMESLFSVVREHRTVIVVFSVANVLILLFFWQYVFTGNNLPPGDFDYYAQLYESFRTSLINYHQFPLWNPWMSGGIPLYANPQFGLISIQSLLVLIFGAVYGIKLAFVFTAIAGYWSMYLLCRRVAADRVKSLLIAFIWIACGFFSSHGAHHFTFSLFFLLPAVLLLLINWRRRYAWVGLGGILSLMALSSIHYGFLMSALFAVIIFGLLLCKEILAKSWSRVKGIMVFGLKTGALFLILASYRIVTTAYFVLQNQRPAGIYHETAPTAMTMLKALFLPVGTILPAPSLQWSWGEYSGYIGMGATITLAILVLSAFMYVTKNISNSRAIHIEQQHFLCLIFSALAVFFFIIALGSYSRFSPYSAITSLPGFSEFRVSSRWIIFTILFVLLVIAREKKMSLAITVLLSLSCAELFYMYGPPRIHGQHQVIIEKPHKAYTVIEQYDNKSFDRHVSTHNIDASYFYSTSKNIGQIYADDSIINTLDKVIGTKRCGFNSDKSCDLVLSDNADVTYWSPNKVVLSRIAPGHIKLNMNVEKGWRINGSYIFADRAFLNPDADFIIPESSNTEYILEYAPKLSPTWLGWRLQH